MNRLLFNAFLLVLAVPIISLINQEASGQFFGAFPSGPGGRPYAEYRDKVNDTNNFEMISKARRKYAERFNDLSRDRYRFNPRFLSSPNLVAPGQPVYTNDRIYAQTHTF